MSSTSGKAIKKSEGSYWPVILCLGVIAALAPLSIDMYLPTFPTIGKEFGANAAQIQLTLSGYMFGFTLGQLCYGPLSDRFGRRPVLLSGIALYIVMTVLCALSTNAEMLTFFRFFQAIGGGAGTVLSRAIVRDLYSGVIMARVMSLMLMLILCAPMIAPVIGGYLLVWMGWRAVFWALAICGVFASFVAIFRIKETLVPERRSTPGLISLLQGYVAVLTHRKALGYILSGGVTFGALFAFISGAPFVFIEFYGVAPEHMGYIFTVNVFSVMFGGWLNTRLVISKGIRQMMSVGTLLLLSGSLLLFVLTFFDIWGVWGAIFGIIIFTLPLNMINSNAAAGALEFFPEKAGTASAVFGAARYGSGAISGVCVGLLYNGTAIPMVAVILVCSIISIIFLLTMVRN